MVAFFRWLADWPLVSVQESGIWPFVNEKGWTVRACIDYVAPGWGPEGKPQYFLRVHWLLPTGALVTYGVQEGTGITRIWKATFDERDALMHAEFVYERAGHTPIGREEAWQFWQEVGEPV